MKDSLGEVESLQGLSAQTNCQPFSLVVVTFEAYAPALGVSWLSHSCTINVSIPARAVRVSSDICHPYVSQTLWQRPDL